MGILDELKRRRVINSGLAYLAAAVVIAEGVGIFGPALGLPSFVLEWVLYALLVGFPVFLGLAWRYDLTLEGIRRTRPRQETAPEPGPADGAGRDEARSGADSEGGTVAEEAPVPPRGRERRQVTVLAARAPGYLEISERLDPEDAQELADRIVEVAEDVCRRLGGRIHRFSGEELTIVFGVPHAHEDDALRGIRAALALRDGVRRIVEGLDRHDLPPLEEGCAVATGVVLAGEGEGRSPEIAGDTLLVARHLAARVRPGSVLADRATFRRTEGVLRFEELPPLLLEGRQEPVELYRLVAPKAVPSTVHDPGGLKTGLVGRKAEMDALGEALRGLHEGRAQVVTVRGEAGTGKSRLVQEFRSRLEEEVGWLEGHAFPYAQDSPYFPVVDLLSRLLGVTDADSAEDVRRKVKAGLARMTRADPELEAWIGSLYELEYPELANVQPDMWRPRLHDAVFRLLSSVALERPTVILLEDLHWADSATVELIYDTIERVRQPVLLLLTYRPGFQLELGVEDLQSGPVGRDVLLGELSASEARDLVEALLGSEEPPEGLTEFVLAKAEGNPFYVEEVVNTLAESGILLRRGGSWRLSRSLEDVTVPPNVQGLILSRVDRLAPALRRTLQEASVIGRTFHEAVLREIAYDAEGLDERLAELAELGVIRGRRRMARSEYVFNHALTQEVIYGSLLRTDRRELHERIGTALERLYPGRLLEFCESLAFHFRRGECRLKAVEYLTKAGNKSWRRYALDESHRYFKEAFDLLADGRALSEHETALLLAVLNQWAIVYNHLGDYRTLADLLEEHEELARSVFRSHPVPAALFLGWLGYALQCRERLEESYGYLTEALEMAMRTGDPEAIAYVSAWTARTCVDMGRLDEALEQGRRAEEMADRLEPDAKLFRFLYSALGLAYYFRGERGPLDEVADKLLEYGERHTDLRSLLLGHVNRGCSHLVAGEFDEAITAYERGINVSVDPMYSMFAHLMLGVTHASAGHLDEAETTLTGVIEFDRRHGFDLLGTTARGMLSIVLLARGDLARGVEVAEEVLESYREHGNRYRHGLQEYMLGRVYLRLALREGSGGLAFMAKNVGFLLRNVPQAKAKAGEHLRAAVEICGEIGAKGVRGQALLDLGRLLDASGRKEEAHDALEEAVTVLEACDATAYLEEARNARTGVAASA